MMKHLFTITGLFLVVWSAGAFADNQSGSTSIANFKAESIYRAVLLTWEVETPLKNEVSFQIIRSDSFVEGPYEEVATVAYAASQTTYEYLDRSLGSESKFYYKLVIKGAGETYGPVAARPYFSPPAT
jgi:hypothetical protein